MYIHLMVPSCGRPLDMYKVETIHHRSQSCMSPIVHISARYMCGALYIYIYIYITIASVPCILQNDRVGM